MFEAKVATITLPLAFEKILVKVSPMDFSEIVCPLRCTFVLSAIRSNTPFLPNSAIRWKSITNPSIGV